MKTIAIIPARSGSKRLKNKNIMALKGKPMIVYTIEAAINSNLFDEIMVSTDSHEYADIAKSFGAKVPFMRSAEQASDQASSWDVVKEILREYKKRNQEFNVAVLLQPTSPLRTSEDIQEAYKIFVNKGANAVVSVCEVDHSPLWTNILPEDNSMEHFLQKGIVTKPRQELESYYRINGAIYIVNIEYLLKSESIYDEKCYAFKMSRRNSIDIDDLLDFRIAETLI